LEEKAIETCSSLKRVFCGGEAISADLKRKFFTCLNAELIHQYGPTETTVDVITWECKAEDDPIVVPIGHPIANTQAYILDANLQPVPVGVQGELYIGGASLARGYLNRPELTAEKFIANPFSYEPDSRIYKTGDLARHRNDGTIEFLGRKDFQVKLRGFRIELGEVEATLCLHPSVSEAVVVAREDRPGDKRLVAYVVAAAAQSAPATGVLRAFLQEKLPDYMIPSAFVFLDALPLTANGKVDRRALPAPDVVRPDLQEAFVAPRNELELQLTKIWEKVLGIKNVGIKDNFFDLGGHSLLAVRLFALIQKRFSKNLPLVFLFQAPTVEQLAEKLHEGIRPTSWTSLVPMQSEGSNPPFFCVPQAGSTVYSLSNLARHLAPNQPFYGLQPLGIDGENSPHTRIEDMAAHYIEEIKSVQPQGPYLLGGRCYGSEVSFEMAQQLCAQGEEVALLALFGDNFIPAWARKGVKSSKSVFYSVHAFQRTIYYLRHSSLGDVFRTAVSEINIRINPYLRDTKRVLNAQLLARANYIRKPYPGRVTLFTAWSSLRPTYSKWTLAGLAEGGVDFQKVPRVYDKLLDVPHVEVVAAKLIACINKVLDERFTTNPYPRQAPFAQARKKDGDSTGLVSGIYSSPGSTHADARPTDPGTRLNLSLVLPCYNEGPHICDNIAEIVQALDAAGLKYEIILIDDRSNDKTAQQIRAYLSGQSKRNIRAYYHDANLGRGATVAEGIRLANGTYVGFIDIDLETPPQFIPAALDALVSDSADMVLGNRKRGGAQESPLRLVMSSVYRWLVSRLLKTDSLDTEAGFKFFKRDLILPVLDEVQDSHWFWDTEITVVAQAKGLRIHSLPVTYCRDLTKQSTVQPFQDSWKSFAALLAFAKRHRFARRDVIDA
jgi:acyl carrier protein